MQFIHNLHLMIGNASKFLLYDSLLCYFLMFFSRMSVCRADVSSNQASNHKYIILNKYHK